jgi:hypothetical protein
MPILAHLMMSRRVTDLGTVEKAAVELYHVVDLTSPDPVDAAQFNQAQGLPLEDAPHPSSQMEGATVRSRRLLQIWKKPTGLWDAYVLVTYSNRSPFSLFNPFGAGGVIDGGTIRIKVPLWRLYTPAGGEPNYFLSWGDETRRTVRMRFTRNATGITQAEKISLINLAGRMYFFPTAAESFNPAQHIPFILGTPHMYRNRFNQDVVEYEFTTELRVGGVAVGPQTDVIVPPLRALEDWVPESTTSTGVIVPTVLVRTAVEKNGGVAPASRVTIPFMDGNL